MCSSSKKPKPADVKNENPTTDIEWFPWKPAEVPPVFGFQRMFSAQNLFLTSNGIEKSILHRMVSMETGGCQKQKSYD